MVRHLIDEIHASTTTLSPSGSGYFIVSDSSLLFQGTFARSGHDLIITGHDGARVFLPDYFLTDVPADIHDEAGAILRGDVAARLAGPLAPGQYAELDAPLGGNPIGQVETLDGGAQVQRADGTVEALQVGAKIYEQDVIETGAGASVSVTFVDGTIFTLASASRMLIDELIYDPDANDNSGGFSLVQGSFVFIAGQVAKTGGMEVSTPASTMGIRGTTVVVQIGSQNGVVTSEITLTQDPDGAVGRVELRDNQGNLVANISDTDVKYIVSAVDGLVQTIQQTSEDAAQDGVLIAEAFAAFRAAVARVDAGDTFVTLSDPADSVSSGEAADGGSTDLEVDALDEPETIDPLNDIEEAPDTDTIQPFDEGLNQIIDEVETPDLIIVQGFEDATEDTAIAGNVTVANAATAGLIFSLGSTPANGTAIVNADGSFSFVPQPNFNGTDNFTFNVSGPDGAQGQGTVVVEVLPVNDAPTAADFATSVPEDSIVSGAITAIDVDGDPLSFSLVDLPANGAVVLLADGTFTYIPEADFNGSDSFVVSVSDPEGESALATVSVDLQSENDAPVVQSNTIFETVEGADVAGSLTAQDVDNTPGELTFALGANAPANGTVVVDGDGSFVYQPDDGFLGVETFEYTVSDGSGETTSGVATIEVESDPNDPDNQNVSVGVNTDADEDTAAGAVEINITPAEENSVNLAIALDRSGSIGAAQWESLLSSVRDALTELASQFEGSTTSVDVQIVTFATDATATQTYDLQDPALLAQVTPEGLPFTGGATAWNLALERVDDFFAGEPGTEANFLLFVTDGFASNDSWKAPLGQIQSGAGGYDVTISAFAFGNSFVLDDLVEFDPGAVFLDDPDLLAQAFATTPIFNPQLLGFEVALQADGGEVVLIADQNTEGLVVEGTDYELPLASIENIIDLLGEENRISVTAQFDVDGDPDTAEINVFSTDVIGKADTAQIINGLDAADLLFGSDDADVISGGAGDDILMGFAGNDTLDAGAGSDTVMAGAGDDQIIVSGATEPGERIDGGVGRDTLALEAVSDITALLASLELSSVEVLDIDNGQADDFALSFDDIAEFSDTSDADLEQLLSAAFPNAHTIFGDTQDSLTLDGQGTYTVEAIGSATMGTDQFVDIYQFSVGGGNALATLAIDNDIAVVTENVVTG
ncbi:MAG: Ig-like domain-containing protein [Roseobacter sp.]